MSHKREMIANRIGRGKLGERRHGGQSGVSTLLVISAVLVAQHCTNGFVVRAPQPSRFATPLFIYAPPGSGYARPEDEKSMLPESYEPMMEYPGTMRPGKTPENAPFQDLPIGDNDPDPVPWPHFQQIEWHHQWEPPHEHPIPMEDFIDMHGRWATPEMEAAMRAGVRRDIRERREEAEAEKRETIITDDDDDDELDPDESVALGEGMFGRLGSAADLALTAEAVAPPKEGDVKKEEPEEDEMEEDLDDFLLDLGLDSEVDEEPETKTSNALTAADDDDDDGASSINVKSVGGDATAAINVEEDEELDLGLDGDDEDDLEGEATVPLDDFSENESLDTEDVFDEGGFDFDDGDFDVDDVW